ncbi:MAG TPA: hypothetical protein VM450_14610 [Thermomicrobiales bacterium]|nr:hypothetical protein [Thermomicrobiales bacterium]
MWDFIGFIITGIVAGWLAGVVTKSDRSIWGDLVLGLAGAVVAGILTDGLVNGDNLIVAIIVSAIAAIILVVLKNMIMGRSRTAS